MNGQPKYVVGVDAGGTKSTAWIGLSSGEQIIGKATHGAGNPRAVGFDTACRNIQSAVSDAFEAAGVTPVTAGAACFCVAGAGRPEEQAALTEWFAANGLANQTRVIADAEAVLAAAMPDDVGITLICGTGSLAWGRNADGKNLPSWWLGLSSGRRG